MSPRGQPAPSPHEHPDHDRKAHDSPVVSPDKERHAKLRAHHPEANPAPHAPHHPQNKPVLPPRHNAHTGPEGKNLNTDHGTHTDRPRPAKISKKGQKTKSEK